MGQAMVAIDEPKCTGCDLCIHHCPFEALLPLSECPPDRKKRPVVVLNENCVGCLSCIGSCPTDALYEIVVPPNAEITPLVISRSTDPAVTSILRWGKGGKGWA
ncbi:MAG: hypothetical protein CXX83_00615 [Methanobacteriota archaeon]|nr:MAG: hypothetical protein CXX83_00615 [Euryarchaeota archaeon]